jgi:hypothetical protein
MGLAVDGACDSHSATQPPHPPTSSSRGTSIAGWLAPNASAHHLSASRFSAAVKNVPMASNESRVTSNPPVRGSLM